MNVIYCRISQDRGGTEKGVERQLADCKKLAARLGLKVAKVYTDNDISATNGKVRPEFEAMLRARPAVIITWHLDRLLRLTSDLEKVIALDVPVHSVTGGDLDLSTPAGRAVARTVTAWATYEGEQKATRLRRANLQRAEAGVWQFSNRPYGYERDAATKRVVVVEHEAEIVREGYRRYLEGDSYYALAEDWNQRGVPTFKGPWSMARVRSMLRNPAYVGERHYQGHKVGNGDWEAIIDRATWDAYLAMRSRRKRAGDWSTKTRHLLSGMVRCGVCGGRMLARPDRARMTVACTTAWCVSRDMAQVEKFVVAHLIARLQDPKVVKRLRATPDTAPIESELAELRRRRANTTELVAEGLTDVTTAREKLAVLTERIDALTRRLDAIRAESPLTDLALTASVPERWASMTLPHQRQVMQLLGMDVTILKTSARRHFDPDAISIEWRAA